MREYIYQKTWFKNTILISIPTIISTIGVIISLLKNQTAKNTLCVVSVFLMICLALAVFFFSHHEDEIYERNKELENELKKLEEEQKKLTAILAHMENLYKTSIFTIASFSELSEVWAKSINAFANNVLSSGKVSSKAWNSTKYFDSICAQCKNMIMKYCNNDDSSKVSVSFVSYYQDDAGDKWVHMIAHSNPESTRPNACKGKQKLSECTYHYAELIREDLSDIEVAVNNEEIRRIFKRISKNTDLSKYTQYIAIPIYCTSQKLLGIFQIVTKYDYIIENDAVHLLGFATESLIPYSNLIVLVDKINKGLYASPKQINEEN